MNLNNVKHYYKTYRIRKPNGKFRIINEPLGDLKRIQNELARLLAKRYECHKCVYGFVKGRSIVDAARVHTGKDWVLNIDIKDFFPSITEEHLSFLNSFELRIALLDGKLPQGSPCSPIITNIVMTDVDDDILEYCNEMKFTYSRYADDMTLSGYGYVDLRSLLKKVDSIISRKNLRINYKKVKFMPKNIRQEVLGVIVNEKVNIKKEVKKTMRSVIHRENFNDKTIGMLSFINMVNPTVKLK